MTPPRAALTFSVLLRPEAVPVARWPWLPLLTGLAVVDGGAPGRRRRRGAEVAQRRAGRRPQGRAGSSSSGSRRPAGAGGGRRHRAQRVARPRDELPVADGDLAGARRRRPSTAPALLVAVLAALRRPRTTAGSAPRAGGLRAAYAAACSTLGREVRVDLPGGRALTAGPSTSTRTGGCWSTTARAVQRLGAGDVVHVRPARRAATRRDMIAPVAISPRLLNEGEHVVVVSTRTHVKALLLPAVVLILVAARRRATLSSLPDGEHAGTLVLA